MSVWGKVVGGMAGFAIGGPLGALMGVFAGHMMVDKRNGGDGSVLGGGNPFSRLGAFGRASMLDRQVAFTVAVIALGAKMAKADGQVTREEIQAFREVFHVPPGEMEAVGKIFNEARQEATGYEPYAAQIAQMFAHQPEVLESLLGGLFHIAKASGGVQPAELEFLSNVAAIFGFDAQQFDRIRAAHAGAAGGGPDPYKVLGISRDASDAEVKRTYRELIRKYHPDAVMAQGMPEEFVSVANEKMAAINAAYDQIEKERGLK